MKSKCLNDCEPFILEKLGKDKTEKIIESAYKRLEQLIDENKNESKEAKALTQKEIYPSIALYEAILKTGIEKEKAVEIMDYAICKKTEPGAKSMQMMMKLPGVYRKYPAMFKSVAKKQFGEKAGFKAKYYDTPKTQVRFDMTHCLYCDVCNKYNCPEIIKCFCHTDDVNNANLHPKLIWARTKIMGDGADCCDFNLYVKEDK